MNQSVLPLNVGQPSIRELSTESVLPSQQQDEHPEQFRVENLRHLPLHDPESMERGLSFKIRPLSRKRLEYVRIGTYLGIHRDTVWALPKG